MFEPTTTTTSSHHSITSNMVNKQNLHHSLTHRCKSKLLLSNKSYIRTKTHHHSPCHDIFVALENENNPKLETLALLLCVRCLLLLLLCVRHPTLRVGENWNAAAIAVFLPPPPFAPPPPRLFLLLWKWNECAVSSRACLLCMPSLDMYFGWVNVCM